MVSFLLQLMDNKKLWTTFLANQKILFIWSNVIINANASISERLNATQMNDLELLNHHQLSNPTPVSLHFKTSETGAEEGRGGWEGKCGRKRTWEEGASFLLSPIPFPFLSFPLASALSTPATQATLKLKEQRRTRRAKGPNGWSLSRFPQHGACLGVLLLPPGLDSSPLHTHLNNWVKRDKVERSSLSKETTRRARLEPQTSRSGVWGVNRSPSYTCLHLHFTPFKPNNA